MDEFFMHENHAWPLSLASNSTVIHTKTALDSISCVEAIVPSETNVPNIDVKIIDGAGVVHRLVHKLVKTFHNYCEYVFLPYIDIICYNLLTV